MTQGVQVLFKMENLSCFLFRFCVFFFKDSGTFINLTQIQKNIKHNQGK